MKERNKKILNDALGRLPEYDAPAGNWSALNRRLSLDGLPTYAPPPAAWNAINEGLDYPARIRRLPLRQFRPAAAALVLLLAAAFALGRGPSPADGPSVTYALSQEPAPATLIVDWDDDEDSFQRILHRIADKDEPTLNQLGSELDELTAAREEVKAMLTAYGEDARMVRQLAEIERERSDVYRRIIVEL